MVWLNFVFELNTDKEHIEAMYFTLALLTDYLHATFKKSLLIQTLYEKKIFIYFMFGILLNSSL